MTTLCHLFTLKQNVKLEIERKLVEYESIVQGFPSLLLPNGHFQQLEDSKRVKKSNSLLV